MLAPSPSASPQSISGHHRLILQKQSLPLSGHKAQLAVPQALPLGALKAGSLSPKIHTGRPKPGGVRTRLRMEAAEQLGGTPHGHGSRSTPVPGPVFPALTQVVCPSLRCLPGAVTSCLYNL